MKSGAAAVPPSPGPACGVQPGDCQLAPEGDCPEGDCPEGDCHPAGVPDGDAHSDCWLSACQPDPACSA